MPFIDLDKEYNLDKEFKSKWCISYRRDNVVYEEKYKGSLVEPRLVRGSKSRGFFIKIEDGEMVIETYSRTQYLYEVDILKEYEQSIMFYGNGCCDWTREFEKDLEDGKIYIEKT